MKLYYIANARLPHKKAYAIQIAKMCEAFVEAGVDLELIVPAQNESGVDLQNYYKLRVPVRIIKLSALDFYARGRLGFFVSSLTFMLSYFFYLLWKRLRGENGIVYVIDMDTFSFIASIFLAMPVFFETHGGKAKTVLNKLFFKHLKGAIVINNIIKKQIFETIEYPEENMLVEPNGIDLELFKSRDKNAARRELLIPVDSKVIMYCGRFYGWKGLEVLASAVDILPPDVFVYIVGGTKEEFMKLISRTKISDNIIFPGEQSYPVIPLWLSAADGLLVLGTKHDAQSYYYTSPMKIFEYMAIERPIIASKTPALQDVLSSHQAVFYEPDNASDLAEKMNLIFKSPKLSTEIVMNARKRVEKFTWSARARRVIEFINANK